jgi:hypothetical protein
MGGKGSGGHNKLSDEEKKKRGTFEKRHSSEAQQARAEQKIITGPWISKVPDPEMPLNEKGKEKYLSLATKLLEMGTLTEFSAMQCEQVAILFQSQMAMMQAGKIPPVSLSGKITGLLAQLRISENATPIGKPPERNKFEGAGFSNSRSSPFRLRASTTHIP